jgi:Fe-S-cluster containining protein
MPEGFCEQCNGKCCTEFTVYITHADAKRLMDHLKKPADAFITGYADDGKCTHPLIKLAEYDVRIGLSYVDKKCCLLNVVGDRRRCTVQSAKPMVCRTYPFSISSDNQLVHVEPYKCPGPIWPPDQAGVEKSISEVKQLKREYKEYTDLVDQWNALPKEKRASLKAFLNFVIPRA